MREAVAHHQAGRFQHAERLYQAVLKSQPENPDANHNFGILLRQQNRHREAIPFLKVALEKAPQQGQLWVSNIDALAYVGAIDVARQLLQQGIGQFGLCGPAIDALASRLGMSVPAKPIDAQLSVQRILDLLGQQRLDEVETYARNHLTQHPDDGLVWKVLAVACKNLGKNADALVAIEQAARLSPEDFEAHYNLGNARYELGEVEAAEQSFRRALAIKPDYAEAQNNLGQALIDRGNHKEAFMQFQSALALKPDLLEAHNNLGNLLLSWRDYDGATEHYQRALELSPTNAEAHCNLGIVLFEQGGIEEAEARSRLALQLRPGYAEAHVNLGNVLQSQGKLRDAEENFRQAIAVSPRFIVNYDNLLFTLNYDPDRSGEEIFETYREFDEQFGLPLRGTWPTHVNDRNPSRRLKIGYVSPDFCHHVVRHFLEPLLAHHDKREVEIFAYAEVRREDDVTARFRTYADHWIPTIGLSDEALAERVRADGIDILVDLAGHTAGNRLLVFARKPAPVSVSWLGYGYTTGLSAIDYLLTDEVSCPAGCEHVFSETPWRVTTPALAYRAPEGMGETSVLPASARGFVSFGTLTRGVRINHRTIRAWSEILKRVGGARLVIDSGHFKETVSQVALADRFAVHGIDRERLEIGCHSPPWDVLRGMDIGLDCFPHNSGTTLFESLYMGVPFVTLAGRPSVGRLGSSILEGVGHSEWIAHSEEEYIEKVVALASDLPKLATLRASLRQQMQASPLMDEAGFARKVEAAYREMFKQWTERRT